MEINILRWYLLMKAKTHLDNCDEKDMKIKFHSEDDLNIILIVKDNIYYLKL